MIKYGNITLTTTITLLTLYHSYLLLVVRLGGYIVNLSDFYSYRLIGKLTDFFEPSGVQLPQHDRDQFHFRRAAFALCCLLLIDQQLKNRVGLALAKAADLRITLNLDGASITSNHTFTHHTRKLLVY